MSEGVLEVKVRSSRRTLASLDTGQLLYLLIDVEPPEGVQVSRIPLNLALIIDRSTSMDGERLERVQYAINHILDSLDEDDLLTLVTFSDRAEIAIPMTPVKNRRRIMSQVVKIHASGGTEMFQGLAAAHREMSQVQLDSFINHMLLLTDGRTYGDETQCLELAAKAAQQNIGLTALGIGSDWNERFLDALVSPSGGQSAYMDDLDQMTTRIRRRIQDLGNAYASSVRLAGNYEGKLQLQTVFRTAPHVQPLTVEDGSSHLGMVAVGAKLAVLLEFQVAPHLHGEEVAVPLELAVDIPGEKIHDHALRWRFRLPIVDEFEEEEPPKALVNAVRLLNFHRMTERTWEDYEAGRLEQAEKRMRHLTGRLIEAGYTQLAQKLQEETRQLSAAGTISLEGRKQLTFGTRRLMPPTESLD